ncbi:MAG: hypothetical protein GX799_00625 [Crenarchaeota archaeon]|jgi:hypothetical protein|nr:hypothetical protein [Thermoproteota archaeon]
MQYVTTVESNALAMIDVLFPYYWIIIGLFMTVCFFGFTLKERSRWLDIALLVQLAFMLFYTPFLMGGFSWSPDSLWHGGVGTYFPSVWEGLEYPLTQYCRSYPLSFLITFSAEQLLKVDIVTYTLYIFPPICIALISSLAYFFVSRIINKNTAFLTMLLALPALHYLEPHVSPFATGTVLLLISLILTTYKNAKAFALNMLVVLALVLTHPISPIFLGVYLFSVILVFLLTNVSFRLLKESLTSHTFKPTVRPTLIILLVFLAIVWTLWTTYGAAPNYAGVEKSILNVVNLNFLKNLISSMQWTTEGQGFIYPEISQLGLFVYAIFLGGVLLTLFSSLFTLMSKRKIDHLTITRIELAIAAIFSAVMSYLLFSSSGERFLLGRGLIFLLIFGAACIATYFSGWIVNSTLKKKFPIYVLIFFLVCSFPVVAYSKESYNTFTPLAEEGLVYLTTEFDLSKHTLSMTSSQQLAAYADLSKDLKLVDFPPNMSRYEPDIVVLRLNSFYFISMRYDLSFTNNSYIELQEYLLENSEYIRVFNNSQFEIYLKKDYSIGNSSQISP